MAQADPIVKRYVEKFIDSNSLEPVEEDTGCPVEFFMDTELDPVLSKPEGGEIEKKNPRVKEIRKLEQEALALLKSEFPFEEEEPQPPAKDAPPAAQREYQSAHAEWDARRVAHETDLVERATILREHPEHKDLFVVSPATRPVYVDREFIKITIPGDNTSVVSRVVRPSDIQKYRAQYDRWKSGQSQRAAGTPLDVLGLSKAQIKTLAFFNVGSVEDLSRVSDASLSAIGPFTAFRTKARDWLATSKGAAPIAEARAETARLKEELAALKAQVAELSGVQGEVRRGPGRPRTNPAP